MSSQENFDGPTQSSQETIDRLNSARLTFITMLGGSVTAVDTANQRCTMEFNVSTDFCHSIDVVQGGFITVMLDAAMSHSVFAIGECKNVSSLEIKTSYLAPTRAGRLRAEGSITKAGYKIAFLEGRLYDDDGILTATASSVAKLIR
ncbi:MAG: PaaI family thioesterase [Halioglobus sp.]